MRFRTTCGFLWLSCLEGVDQIQRFISYPNTTLDVEVPLFSSILGMNWWPHEERSKNSFWVDFLSTFPGMPRTLMDRG